MNLAEIKKQCKGNPYIPIWQKISKLIALVEAGKDLEASGQDLNKTMNDNIRDRTRSRKASATFCRSSRTRPTNGRTSVVPTGRRRTSAVSDTSHTDLAREFARISKMDAADDRITDDVVHESLVEALTGSLGAKAVRMLRDGQERVYKDWLTLGANLHEMGVDVQRVIEVLTDCFTHGEDVEREFCDLLDDVWIEARRACVQAARESALRRSKKETGRE